jgi:hypothetical protein
LSPLTELLGVTGILYALHATIAGHRQPARDIVHLP